MALEPLEERLHASEKFSAQYSGPEKAKLPQMLKDITSYHDFRQTDAPPKPICRHYGNFFRFARYILLALLLGLISQFWNVHFPWFSTLNLAMKTDLLSKTGKPNVESSSSAVSQPASPLVPFTFRPLPLGCIKPLGWLQDQMGLMANGLAGHQYESYPIVGDSPWLGGSSEYSGLNEGLPYWFNGVVPLAYGLDDDRLKMQVHEAMEYVLDNQQADGWLGPEVDHGSRDIWGRFPLLLGLCQLADADSELSPKIIQSVYRFINLMHEMLSNGEGFNEIWGRVRYPDMLICLQWLYEHHPRGVKDNNTLETMHKLKHQGLSWADYYSKRNYIAVDLDTINPPITAQHKDFPFVHGVNAGQGLKSGATIYRFTAEESILQSTLDGVNWTFTFHGDVAGSIIGDERESNLSPNRGSELCTAVETMYSLSYLYQVLGNNDFADRCELAAFNALPVAISSNHWERQYLTVANQPFSCWLHGPNGFWNVGDGGLVYGRDTNYPCCTVNMPQGLPKFLSASFVSIGPNGLGHALLIPARVEHILDKDTRIRISCETNYPFSNNLHYTIEASAGFTFHVRVPAWYVPEASFLSIDGGPPKSLTPEPHTGMMAVHVHAGKSTIEYTLSATLRVTPRANATISIYYGALLYALDVGQSAIPAGIAAHSCCQPNDQYESLINSLPWNMAIDPSTLKFHPAPPNVSPDDDLPSPIWSPKAPPSYFTAKGCEIEWPLLHCVPAPVPLPVYGKRTCTGKVVDMVLRPYGSLKVHMAELPTIDLELDP